LTSLRRPFQNSVATKTRKNFVLFLGTLMFAATAHAVPMTHFLPNASGGFEAFLFPELTNGTPSLQGGIFTLPQAVNPGFVIILNSPTANQKDPSTWLDVIQFFDSGTGVVNSVQLLRGGPNQSTYYPTLKTVSKSADAFVTVGTDSNGMFTTFTDYSVVAAQTRTYHFYTGAFPIAVPDEGTTLGLFGLAILMLFMLHRTVRRAATHR
jgi:hypothetical protein